MLAIETLVLVWAFVFVHSVYFRTTDNEENPTGGRCKALIHFIISFLFKLKNEWIEFVNVLVK